MLTLGKITKYNSGGGTRLSCEIDIDGNKSHAWYEVNQEDGEYLCDDRCDAFLVAAIPWALANGHDIYYYKSYTGTL